MRRRYPEALRALVVESVVVIVNDTFDHKLYARVKGESSGHGNYFAWCFLRKWRTRPSSRLERSGWR